MEEKPNVTVGSEMSFMKEESFTPCPLAAAFGKWTFPLLCCGATGVDCIDHHSRRANGGSTVVVGVLSIHVRLVTGDSDERLNGMEKLDTMLENLMSNVKFKAKQTRS